MKFFFEKPAPGDPFAIIPTIGVQRVNDLCGVYTYAIGLYFGQYAVGVSWTR